jgi:hypothetical protein
MTDRSDNRLLFLPVFFIKKATAMKQVGGSHAGYIDSKFRFAAACGQ